jgi:exosome complex component RRP41
MALRQTFESIILLDMYPGSQIDIYVHIIEADGGERSVAVNAATLALIDAGVMMSDIVVSCTAGIIGSTAVVDLCQNELPASAATLTLALEPRTDAMCMMELDSKIPSDMFLPLVEVCTQGCHHVKEMIQNALKENMLYMLGKNSALSSASLSVL